MTDLFGIPITTLGASGLLAIVVLMLITGRLHTHAEMVRVETAHAASIERIKAAHLRELEDSQHERAEWRTEARLKDQTIVEQAAQITALTSGFEALKEFLVGLRRAGVGPSAGGDDA